MENVPHNLKYARTHEWAQRDEDIVTIGITDHAQDLLGDIVYIELPEIGAQVSEGDECGVVESVKAASDIYSPVSGEVIDVNEVLAETPALVNDDPYGSGWIFRIKLKNPEEFDSLMSAESYQKQIGQEVH
jgi:glycine cleavage system H protein